MRHMNFKNITIGVLMGGPSAEREVSFKTGINVCTVLRERNYAITPLMLGKDLSLSSGGIDLLFPEALKKYDIIFNALHGTFGEDGQLQAMLDALGVRYTGSGAEASALGMDKWKSREIFRMGGLVVPESHIWQKRGDEYDGAFPAVVKPRASGSSDGVFLVETREALREKAEQLMQGGTDVIVEEYCDGREFTCGVLEQDGIVRALPVVEIRPEKEHGFFDYEAKYVPGAATETVPALLDEQLTAELQCAAVRAHELIGCRVYSRTDIIVSRNKAYVLEINTLPGLTETSLLPKAAKAAGIDFADLTKTILAASLARYEKGNK